MTYLDSLELPTLTALSTDELFFIEGGLNYDNLVDGIVTVAIIVGAVSGAPAIAIVATLFGAAYNITRAFG